MTITLIDRMRVHYGQSTTNLDEIIGTKRTKNGDLVFKVSLDDARKDQVKTSKLAARR